MTKVVYVAGKYRGKHAWEVSCNIRDAQVVASKVWAMGLVALCPHMNSAFMEGLYSDELILEGTKELLRRCDAVMLVSNWRQSEGAKGEVEEAKAKGIPIFGYLSESEGLEDLERWAQGKPVKHGQQFGPGPFRCNLHDDCGAADVEAKAAGKDKAYHCHSDDCEDCFPK